MTLGLRNYPISLQKHLNILVRKEIMGGIEEEGIAKEATISLFIHV